MKKIIFKDCYKIVQPSKEDKLVWSDATTDSSTRKSLWVSMDASHAGMGNRNNRFYLPSKMKDGAITFLGKKGKTAPILKHHGADQDPVGKVRGVEYIPTIPKHLADDDNIDFMIDSSIPLKKQVRAARKFLQNDFVNEDEWEGLGHIRLDAEILAPEAIEQIEDGRFDSVSVSFSTNRALCSICQTDWLEDRCEHRPGKVYKDEETGIKERMLLIPDNMNFKECSLVTFDADPHSAISIIEDMEDEKAKAEVFTDSVLYPADKMIWEVKDSEKGAIMKKINLSDGASIELSDSEEAIFDIVKKHRPEAKDAELAKYAKTIASTKQDDGTYENQTEAGLNKDDYILYALEDLETQGQELKADDIYSDMVKELEAMVKDGTITEEEMKDAELSTEQRKKLSKSTFCGPDRSFPVPDCAHVTAAKRLVGRYKGPGSKSSILACVNRKAKALGCNGDSCSVSSDEPVKENNDNTTVVTAIDELTDDALRDAFNIHEAEMRKRNLTVKRECTECANKEAELKDHKQKTKDSVKDLETANSTIEILRDELRNEFSNYKILVDDSVEKAHDFRELQTKYAAAVAVLSNKADSISKATDLLSSAENFNKQYDNFTDSVDLGEIFDKINNGMVNKDPEGQVEDPTINDAIDNNQAPEGLSSTEKAIVERCKEHIQDGDYKQARVLYDRMITKGILRDSVKWETILPADEEADK